MTILLPSELELELAGAQNGVEGAYTLTLKFSEPQGRSWKEHSTTWTLDQQVLLAQGPNLRACPALLSKQLFVDRTSQDFVEQARSRHGCAGQRLP